MATSSAPTESASTATIIVPLALPHSPPIVSHVSPMLLSNPMDLACVTLDTLSSQMDNATLDLVLLLALAAQVTYPPTVCHATAMPHSQTEPASVTTDTIWPPLVSVLPAPTLA